MNPNLRFPAGVLSINACDGPDHPFGALAVEVVAEDENACTPVGPVEAANGLQNPFDGTAVAEANPGPQPVQDRAIRNGSK